MNGRHHAAHRVRCKARRSACVTTSVSVCLSVCPLAYLTSMFHQILCTRYMWPWLGALMTTMQCVNVLPVFVDDVMLSRD